MFEDSSVFVLAGGNNNNEVYRIDVDDDTQKAICQQFSEAKEILTADKNRTEFDGSYKPEENEFLVIKSFQIAEEIKNAIRDPMEADPFQKYEGEFPEIKSIFVGERFEIEGAEHFNIAFQRFRKEQYISTRRFNLFFSNDTFFRQNSFGISISDSIDCFYADGELQFISFFFARQVFDLGSYYRVATDTEVDSFVTNTKLEIKDKGSFVKMADTWIRRKIAMINESRVLDNYSASVISERAREVGVSIELAEDRIVLPNDKKEVKIILGFLDEEAYKGPFSQDTFLANSKRRIDRV